MQIISQRKASGRQKIPEPYCTSKKTWNGNRKIMQPNRIKSESSKKMRKWKPSSTSRWTSIKVIPLEKTHGFSHPFLQLIQYFQVAIRSTSLDMTIVFHSKPDGRFLEIKNIWTDDFSSWINPSILASTIPELFKRWIKNIVFSQYWIQHPTSHPSSKISRKSDSSSEVNYSCCKKSEAWPHLQKGHRHTNIITRKIIIIW